MFTATKIESTIKPKKLESLNNGVWYYNYDIVEKTIMTKDIDNQDKEELRYEFIQVRINGKPTYSKCYAAVLKTFVNEYGINLYENQFLDKTSNEQYDEIAHLIKVDFGIEQEEDQLDRLKKKIIRKIEQYDTSDYVNSFTLNGYESWLDKGTRVGLMNSINLEKNSGKNETILWINNNYITINCDAAIQMLSNLELYAVGCYNTTAQHKVNVQNLNDLEQIENYDYTIGYPEKLSFTI